MQRGESHGWRRHGNPRKLCRHGRGSSLVPIFTSQNWPIQHDASLAGVGLQPLHQLLATPLDRSSDLCQFGLQLLGSPSAIVPRGWRRRQLQLSFGRLGMLGRHLSRRKARDQPGSSSQTWGPLPGTSGSAARHVRWRIGRPYTLRPSPCGSPRVPRGPGREAFWDL